MTPNLMPDFEPFDLEVEGGVTIHGVRAASEVRGQSLDCGHSPQEERPAQTAAALLEFLLERRRDFGSEC
jgi:pimeloyl-ACP methyl ester carboxylesterase